MSGLLHRLVSCAEGIGDVVVAVATAASASSSSSSSSSQDFLLESEWIRHCYQIQDRDCLFGLEVNQER